MRDLRGRSPGSTDASVSASSREDRAKQAAEFLAEYPRLVPRQPTPGRARATAPRRTTHGSRALSDPDALADWVGFAHDVADLGGSPVVETATSFAKLPNAIAIIQQGRSMTRRELRAAALAAGNAVRARRRIAMLADMPVERLKEATPRQDPHRCADRGRHHQRRRQVLDHERPILNTCRDRRNLRRTGSEERRERCWQTTFDEMPVRIDIKNRTRGAHRVLAPACGPGTRRA